MKGVERIGVHDFDRRSAELVVVSGRPKMGAFAFCLARPVKGTFVSGVARPDEVVMAFSLEFLFFDLFLGGRPRRLGTTAEVKTDSTVEAVVCTVKGLECG